MHTQCMVKSKHIADTSFTEYPRSHETRSLIETAHWSTSLNACTNYPGTCDRTSRTKLRFIALNIMYKVGQQTMRLGSNLTLNQRTKNLFMQT